MLKQDINEIIFHIQRIYTKDISFEVPHAPKIFQKTWKPQVKLNLNINSNKLLDNIYEVILCVTINVSLENDTAFLCEVHQAGIFNIAGVDNNQINYCLGTCCPDVLFPYARECINNQISRGSFPQLNLAPINFNKIFLNCFKKIKDKDTRPNHEKEG